MRKRRRNCVSDWVLDITKWIMLSILVIVTIYPFWNILILSLNDANDTMRGGLYFFPRKFTMANYQQIFEDEELLHSVIVSAARVLIVTPLNLIVTAQMAYAVFHRDLVGRKFWNLMLIFTMYFGGGQVPYYMIIKHMHLLDTFWVFVVPGLFSVYNMILIRTYIESLPQSLLDAVKIDGGSHMTIFWKIVMPLSKPICMTVCLFTAIGQWNAWFDAYLYTSSPNLKPLQAVLVEILNLYQIAQSEEQLLHQAEMGIKVTPDSIRMATTIVATVPIIMVYPFVQKYFVKGVMIGAVKA